VLLDETVSYDYLLQAYEKEKQTNQLLLIPKTFYEDSVEFIEKTTSTNKALAENYAKLLNDLFEKRKQKILLYVAYGKQLPQPISNSETEFYNKILQSVKEEKLDLAAKKDNGKPALKSLRDIPEIILPSGKKVGPLNKDKIVMIDEEQDMNYLVENKICEKFDR